ncbi:MAG: 5'-nucleotidase C-terminal domain-containing protein [Flavobacteriales bacterium]|nr:5'-nucleotidase C-terminal domain-containing protein [Flavobacteriales bacterium]
MKNNWVYFLILCLISCNSNRYLQRSDSNFIEINQTQESDKKLNRIIEPYKKEIHQAINTKISYSEIEFTKDGNPNLLGNLSAFLSDEIMQEYCEKNNLPKVDFVLLNHGGLRSIFPKGDILVKHVFEVFPFENEYVIVKLNGKYLPLITDYLIQNKKLHPVCGIQLKSIQNQLEEFKINNKPVDKNKNYYIATSDYLANGGDNMTFFQKADTIFQTEMLMRDALINQIKKYKELPIIKEKFLNFN